MTIGWKTTQKMRYLNHEMGKVSNGHLRAEGNVDQPPFVPSPSRLPSFSHAGHAFPSGFSNTRERERIEGEEGIKVGTPVQFAVHI